MDIFAEQQKPEFDVNLEEMHKDLNPMQRQAAYVTGGPCILVASAGAGKTKTLIHNVATQIANGTPPSNIMVVTFTTKAAEEIKHRLQSMIGDHAQYITAGTFHSVIFQKFLRSYPESDSLRALGIDMTECTILDEDDSKKIMKDVIKGLPKEDQEMAKDMNWTPKAILGLMGIERSMGRDIEAFRSTIHVGDEDEQFKRFVYRVWGQYNQMCRAANGMDFDDILLIADYMLRQEPHIAKELSGKYTHLILDEYQDTNRIQMSIMDSIAKYHSNILVVGDEKQSIYMFRAADVGVMIGFNDRYPSVNTINMNYNYRSKEIILRAANACAAAMPSKITDGQVEAQKPGADDGGEVNLVEFDTDEDEADMLARALARDIKVSEQELAKKNQGLPYDENKPLYPNEISVLYRQRNLRTKLEEKLVKYKVPYKVVGDRSFFQRKEVRDVVALVSCIFRPWDKMSIDRVVGEVRFNFSRDAMQDYMANHGVDAMGALTIASEETLKNSKSLKAYATRLNPFLRYLASIKKSYENGDPPEVICNSMANLWDLTLRPRVEAAAHKAGGGTELEIRVSYIKQVIDRIRDDLESGMDIEEVLDEIKMMVNADDKMDRNAETKVNLMTMHASKGLEFKNVYIMGMNNVVMPSENIEPAEVEENRRLFYVAITRAQTKLAVTSAKRIFLNGQPMTTTRSTFVNEICNNDTGFKVRRHVTRSRGMSPGR